MFLILIKNSPRKIPKVTRIQEVISFFSQKNLPEFQEFSNGALKKNISSNLTSFCC